MSCKVQQVTNQVSQVTETKNIPDDVVAFQTGLNNFYLNPETSILSEEQRIKLKMLKGHPFFPYDPD